MYHLYLLNIFRLVNVQEAVNFEPKRISAQRSLDHSFPSPSLGTELGTYFKLVGFTSS